MAEEDTGGGRGGSIWDTFSRGKVGKVPVWAIMGGVVVVGAYIIAKRRANTATANAAGTTGTAPLPVNTPGQPLPYAGGDTFITVLSPTQPGGSTSTTPPSRTPTGPVLGAPWSGKPIPTPHPIPQPVGPVQGVGRIGHTALDLIPPAVQTSQSAAVRMPELAAAENSFGLPSGTLTHAPNRLVFPA